MSVKIAINGFGRIGRLAFRQMFGAEGYEIVAINDLTSPKMLAHLLKYDSAQGRYALADKVTCSEEEGWIAVDGKVIKIYAEKDAANCPWKELDVDVVLECTGFYCSKEKSMAHINAGAKKVIISAPAGKDLKTIVFNVNHETLTADDQVISAASCTTNCLAPMAFALNHYAPIQSGIIWHAIINAIINALDCANNCLVITGICCVKVDVILALFYFGCDSISNTTHVFDSPIF